MKYYFQNVPKFINKTIQMIKHEQWYNMLGEKIDEPKGNYIKKDSVKEKDLNLNESECICFLESKNNSFICSEKDKPILEEILNNGFKIDNSKWQERK